MSETEKYAGMIATARGIVGRLRDAGHSAWFVGGCVRDRLLGIPVKDVDIATSARPEDVESIFPRVRFVGARFGVALVMESDFTFEVATFRKDGHYRNHRHPVSVSPGTMEDDAARRDFTINALYQDPFTDEVVDLVGGQDDLRAGRVRCVGDPRRRFNEDALRLLRAIRFSARFGFELEEATSSAMRELAHTIEYISPERHREELTRMLLQDNPSQSFRTMDDAGLLRWVLPEIDAMKGVEQGRTWHPEGDVFQHTMLVIDHVEPRTVVNCWAALLHDVGKPPTYERDAAGHITFYDHQYVGGEMAEEIMGRLRFSTEEIQSVAAIVRRHMTFKDITRMKKSTLRRFLSAPTIDGDLAVHRADCLGSRGFLEYYDYAREKLDELASREEPVLPPRLLNGRDLIALGFVPGPVFQRILSALEDKQMEGEIADREAAIEWVRENEW